MKILLSAYWCKPDYGSEQGVGWNFAEQLALQGHEVTVITQEAKESVEYKYSKERYPNITFIYFSLPEWFKKIIFRGTGPLAHLYYFFWQIAVALYLRKYLRNHAIDIIHHITLAVFRTPVFLGLLGKPFIFGPVGGGEVSTFELQKFLPLNFKFKERLRHWINYSVKINPICWIPYQHASLILLTTTDNLKYIPQRYHYKCKVSLGIGIQTDILKPVENAFNYKTNFNILFAGRLEYWKGVHLAIKAYAQISKHFSDVTFTIIGSGSDEKWIRQVATQEKVEEKIKWVPRVPQKDLFTMYNQYDLLLFPSLHDSGGGVVIEALAHGLPVVCLDLGGPKEIVNDSCGSIVTTHGFSEKQIISKISETVNYLICSPEILSNMRFNAIQRAKSFTWDVVVTRTYSFIEKQILKTY